MRKLRDRILPLLLSIFCVLVLLPTQALAAGAVDLNQNVTLTLQYEQDGSPISNVPFDLYYVAEVDEYAEFTLAGEFKDYPVQVNGLAADAWKTLAEMLKSYAEQDKLRALDCGETNDNGTLSFPNTQKNLKPGLYLVVGKTLTKDGYHYKTEPFLVALPNLDSDTNTWSYDVTAEPKHTREELPPSPSDDTVSRKVIKVWKDDVESLRPQEVIIQLLKDGEVYDTVSLSEQNNWRHTWDELPKYNTDGAKVEWSVTEKAVDDYTVLIEKNGITFTVTNTYAPETTDDTVKRIVTKIWEDKGYESRRPGSVQVTLLQNGTAYDTVTLNEANDWLYTWDALPQYSADGKECSWTIQETDVSGYVSSVNQNGCTFVLTNTLDKQKLPQTGMLWWPVPLLTVGGLCFLILGAVGRKKKRHDETQ